jgi:hypothetical protein
MKKPAIIDHTSRKLIEGKLDDMKFETYDRTFELRRYTAINGRFGSIWHDQNEFNNCHSDNFWILPSSRQIAKTTVYGSVSFRRSVQD